jgi:hypothetical protein
MAMQGFKACSGRPTGSHAEVLSALAIKLAGWSSKKEKDAKMDRRGSGAVMDVQVTLRRYAVCLNIKLSMFFECI